MIRALLLAAAAASLALADDDAGAAGEPFPEPPRGIDLDVRYPTRLLAPPEAWFEERAQASPERFDYDEDLGAWVDAEGEYVFDEEEEIYWEHVSVEELTRGKRLYVQYCASCHGVDGQGRGRSGVALRPPPRNFTQGLFKFTKVPGEFLPSDEALVTLIERGLNGTPMLPWALSERQLHDVVTYLKSLSPKPVRTAEQLEEMAADEPDRFVRDPRTGEWIDTRGVYVEGPEEDYGKGWRDPYNEIGEVVETAPDPWDGDVEAAVARGEEVYHGLAGCYQCHPGYVTPAKLNEYRGVEGDEPARPNLSYPALKGSSYEVMGQEVQFFPPDFTWHELRAGTSVVDLYQTIAAGIGGTAMPMWKGMLEERDLWGMAHYVRHLIEEYKDTPARAALMAELRR